jgi:hypothetical protein
MKRIVLVISLIACAGFFNIARGQTSVEPGKAENIRRLMEVTGAYNMTRQMIDQMMAMLKKDAPADKPEIRDKVFRIYEEEMHKVFTAERVNAYLIPIYDKSFTADELSALIAFYESPLGKKVIGALPQVFTEASAAGELLGREVEQRASARLTTEVWPLLESAPNSPPPAKRRPTRRRPRT